MIFKGKKKKKGFFCSPSAALTRRQLSNQLYVVAIHKTKVNKISNMPQVKSIEQRGGDEGSIINWACPSLLLGAYLTGDSRSSFFSPKIIKSGSSIGPPRVTQHSRNERIRKKKMKEKVSYVATVVWYHNFSSFVIHPLDPTRELQE